MASLILKGSVGLGKSTKGNPHNDPSDVTQVRNRLVELGYSWIAGKTKVDKEFVHVIKLFQSIIKGKVRVDGVDGRIDLRGNTHRWMAAENAPGWINMAGKGGMGYRCVQVDYGNSYATSWMADRLALAGLYYNMTSIFGNKPPMWVRDFSKEKGGKTWGHGTHQTGLNVDMRLPIKGKLLYDHSLALRSGAKDKNYSKLFDVDAARLQLKAIDACMDPRVVLFNDKQLIRERLCRYYKNHGGHYHITIKPPVRQEGIYQ